MRQTPPSSVSSQQAVPATAHTPSIHPRVTPIPEITDNDPQAIWEALLRMTGSQPALAWLGQFTLDSINDSTATLLAKPGSRDVFKFASTPKQRERVSELLLPIINRRVRVELKQGDQLVSADSAEDAQSVGRHATDGTLQREVLNQPLVKQVLDLFDAQLIRVEKEKENDQNEKA